MPAESARVVELRRRVEADPASTVFAQLAEEYHRLGNAHAAVACCRAGLEIHPTYLSARVILGRALASLGQLDEAAQEFGLVLHSAPDNLAALRGLAEIGRRRGTARPEGTVAPPDRPAPVPAPPVAPAQPVDFDAILTQLGAPGLPPPPQTVALIEAVEAQSTTAPAPEVVSAPAENADVLAELEAWLSAIQSDRT